MVKHSKRYTQIAEKIDPQTLYSPEEAIDLIKEMASAKFDETVELHLRTASDPRHSDQLVRGVVTLPHGLGKPIRVLVFTMGEAAVTAREAGAEYVGDDDLIKQIEDGWMEFDVTLATPDMMGRIGKLGRFLGRRGLMPNPRTGTVVQPQDIPGAVEAAKKGRLEYRMDRTALIHVPIGKAGFEGRQLLDNLSAVMEAIVRAQPNSVKGQFIRGAYLTTTMGPSVKLDVAAATALRVE
ncbi:MAG: 50S ribosomal protein L1 [Candidatus Hydrogenedentota bacterium]|nr:MAG: 50S ribosomal protein L1 [Candidatus Hydrogenedentota bacterium]